MHIRSHADAWLAAWNAHDLDAIITCYSEDVDFPGGRAWPTPGRTWPTCSTACTPAARCATSTSTTPGRLRSPRASPAAAYTELAPRVRS
jgi:hypothetical protein